MDIIQNAINRLELPALQQLAAERLEQKVKQALASPSLDPAHRMMAAGESLQRLMRAEQAMEFARELFDEAGIDCRNPRPIMRGRAARTPEQWEAIAASRPIESRYR